LLDCKEFVTFIEISQEFKKRILELPYRFGSLIATYVFVDLFLQTSHDFIDFSYSKFLVNTLGTGVANLRIYGSTMADRRRKFAFLSHLRFESIIHCSVAFQLGDLS
jgi:hypothetical protein